LNRVLRVILSGFTLVVFLFLAGCSEESGKPGTSSKPENDLSSGETIREDQPEDKSILLSGPERSRGIDVLPPNVIEHYHGVYWFQGEKVRVQLTREEVVPLSGWEQARCGDYPLFRLPRAADGNTLFYQNPGGAWSVFITIPDEIEDTCLFMSRFIERLIYFMGVSRGGDPAPFPAVLELQ
jgi:hypothetical protein